MGPRMSRNFYPNIYVTKAADSLSNAGDRPAPLTSIPVIDPITAEMERAGVQEAREFRLGGDLGDLVRAVYMAKEYERLTGLVLPPR